ncbi:TBC1 domain family member 16-like [Amphibalanus amphitrite]|uniref:TBC1 domain family member 16-like n=1 Tax=Amphibalanus amphitrite TaxID=1232801 RepID=UPI001C92082C|nr:TBC1 domain family member 16-like [Amphibalanus amphitrite]XP_043219418.1 TBC1 domain family member 16-like [Amphibalanus amphitrite]XP_043219419.1 TBC1 domain family member 16-like [Amphibalanus amphitrite]XP_043219420.1 TBC1 domain family member 16-like [Amphibalanus amphitrite]XP_043219421.1 TBC1 domain family member 16-like [Amphibalanus amphitrite]XP_043219422.1 TBC1 domain family member 16-like [Amphibalanus amphitrite]XP_043219423.1 TBC1 domain family member 16-like [Amphibalanus am
MKMLWNMLSRSGMSQSSKSAPEMEDDEMLFSKNNVCMHPSSPVSTAPRHSLGYLTVTAAPDPVLGHTLLLSWRPNQLLIGGGLRRGQRSLSETQAGTAGLLAAGDAATRLSRHPDVTGDTNDVIPNVGDVTINDADGAVCNGVVEHSGADTADCAAPPSGARPEPLASEGVSTRLELPAAESGGAARLELPAAESGGARLELPAAESGAARLELPKAEGGQTGRRLSTQSAPPSPQARPPPGSEAPEMFTVDLGQARSVRVFLTPGDPGCGQLVLCSRQSQYRILHFHCGGLEKLVCLLDGWKHLRSAGPAADDGGCRLFSVCGPSEQADTDHPEEGRHDPLTEDLWQRMVDHDGRLTDPDHLRRVVFFGGLAPSLRSTVWPLLLGVLSCSDSYSERQEHRHRLAEEFERICALPDAMSLSERAEFQRLVVTVDKDVVRTEPGNPFFCGRANPNVQTLRRILLGFAAANPFLGYTQGMSDLLAPLLVILGEPADAFWALDALIKRSAAVICPRDDVMDVQLGYLRELLRLLTPEFYRHLSTVEDGLELLFTHRWLLLCFKREFAEPAALRIWEACWSCQQTRHFSLFVCAAICAAYAADVTDSAMNADAILLHFTSLSQHMDGDVVLRKARGLLYQFLSLDEVPCSLASLCTTEDGAGPWAGRRLAPVVCKGHGGGARCPAAR